MLPTPQAPVGYSWQGSWRNATVVTTAVLHYTGKFDSPQSVIDDNLHDWRWLRQHPNATAEEIHEAGVRASPRSFHYVVSKEGEALAFVPHAHTAWHCPGRNSDSIGIEHFAAKGEKLTLEQGAGTIQLLIELRALYPNLHLISGHRFVCRGGIQSTDCPGDLWGNRRKPDEVSAGLRAWVTEFLPGFAYVP